MPVNSIGDMRQYFLNTRHNTALKTELFTLVQELNTGVKDNLTSHLGVGQPRLADFDRSLSLAERYKAANTQTAQLLSSMQTALGAAENHREQASADLILINQSSTSSQIVSASQSALQSFEGVISAVNTRLGDRAIFGGTETDTAPLADVDTILDDIRLSLVGLTTSEDLSDAIDDWFNTPGAGFDTVAYLGDTTGFMQRSIDEGQQVQIGLRADDTAVRELLSELAKGVFGGDQTLALDNETRRTLQQNSGTGLIAASVSLTTVRADLGLIEGRVEETSVRISAQQTSITIARNDLVNADPFETASRLDQIQLQLETHYTLTARLSNLTLLEYLR